MGDKDALSLLGALGDDKKTSIRLNPFKNCPVPVSAGRIPWAAEGYLLEERPRFTLDPHLHAGAYYVQESSSMFLEELLRQVLSGFDNLKILDLCGAPGGKATHLASLAGESSLVVSNEVIRQRANILAENVSKWGSGNTIVTNSDPSRFSSLEGFFDIMVVDAPCSGEGMFREQSVVNEWSIDNTQLCSERQRRILMDAWPTLKNEGILVYSTCTFNPEENEKNIEWLSQHEELESIRLSINPSWGISEIIYKNIYGYAFYPGRVEGEGFFICACRKRGRGNAGNPRVAAIKTNTSSSDRSAALEWIKADPSMILRLNDLLVLAATDLQTLSVIKSRLNILKAGTAVATIKGSKYIPNHELALSIKLKREAFPVIRTDLQGAIDYLKRLPLNFSRGSIGWYLVEYEGSVAGFVKNIGSRFNNYYPQEWRIRQQ